MRDGMTERKGRIRMRILEKVSGNRTAALILSGVMLCTAALTGCSGAGSGGSAGAEGGEKAITVAINSETGTMDPAGSIALTYLASLLTRTERSSTGQQSLTK